MFGFDAFLSSFLTPLLQQATQNNAFHWSSTPTYNFHHAAVTPTNLGEPNSPGHRFVDLTDPADQQGDGTGGRHFFYENNLANHDAGFDAISNFGRDDALVFAAQIPDPNNDGILDLVHGILETGNSAVHLFNDQHRSISHLQFAGPVEFGSDVAFAYTRVGSPLHNDDIFLV